MINSFRTHPVRWTAGAAAGVAVLGWLAFGFFGVHTLFIDDVVSEAAPVFDTPAVPQGETSVTAAGPVAPTTPPTVEAPGGASTTGPEPAGGTPVPGPAPTTTPPSTVPPSSVPTEPVIVTEAAGTFTGSGRYSTAGEAVVLGNGTGQRFLRFENFETSNGPDLNVYLVNSSTGDVSDYIDLGDLKGNIGEQNYEIPEGVDLSVYDTVWIWCVRFSSGFGSAELMPA